MQALSNGTRTLMSVTATMMDRDLQSHLMAMQAEFADQELEPMLSDDEVTSPVKVDADVDDRRSLASDATDATSIEQHSTSGEELPKRKGLRFKVVHPGGADVQQGVELDSDYVRTIPKGGTVRILERVVLEGGVARMRTKYGWILERVKPADQETRGTRVVVPAFAIDKHLQAAITGVTIAQDAKMLQEVCSCIHSQSSMYTFLSEYFLGVNIWKYTNSTTNLLHHHHFRTHETVGHTARVHCFSSVA
jgi:hypothetical protein